ncbi:unnamed protein product [Nesidiocoris tenuis]|uniref:Uncharacterized protein n=1 Tax=Nesidiocoris tenuis TaxID=355587 RepID=A0A6H5GFW4_9HEMI|nr:unnamed protein product [Nesidiocoris tenuis]
MVRAPSGVSILHFLFRATPDEGRMAVKMEITVDAIRCELRIWKIQGTTWKRSGENQPGFCYIQSYDVPKVVTDFRGVSRIGIMLEAERRFENIDGYLFLLGFPPGESELLTTKERLWFPRILNWIWPREYKGWRDRGCLKGKTITITGSHKSSRRGLRLPFVTGRGYRVQGKTALSILLRRLAYPNRLSDLERLFGLSGPALSTICTYLTKILMDRFGHLLDSLPAYINAGKLQYFAKVCSAM